MSLKLYTQQVGDHTFAFGNLALRRFTEAMNCAPTIGHVHSAFQGATQIGALIEMIRAGVGQAAGKLITEYEAAAIADNLDDQQQNDLLTLFFSSIVGQPFEEYLSELQKAIEAAEKEGQEASQTVEESPKS